MPAHFLALLLFGQLLGSGLPASAEETTLRADYAEVEEGVLFAVGGVVLQSGGLLLRAGEVEYDLSRRQGEAREGLLLVDGDIVLRARSGAFSLLDQTLSVNEALLVQKQAPIPPRLAATLDFSRLQSAGRNSLVLRAAEVERLADGRFLARRLRMTPCDCGARTPDWSIAASRADVETGERAILTWPVFYAKRVPILALPALYVPLSDRRTGLLFTRFGNNARSGFLLEQPFFLTLGESYDLTLSGGYFFGRTVPEGQRPGIRGPRASAELRWAPAAASAGRFHLVAVDDHSPELLPAPGAAAGPARGGRGELRLEHATFSGPLEWKMDAHLVTDDKLLSDTATYIVNPYLRSQARLSLRGRDRALTLSSAWYQDLQSRSPLQRPFFGPGALVSTQRPWALQLGLPSRPVLGPVRADLELTLARVQDVAPLGTDFPALSAALSRLDLRSRAALPLSTGSIASELYAIGHADLAWLSPLAPGADAADGGFGRLALGARSSLSAGRTYGSGPRALRHLLEPELELRALSPAWGRWAPRLGAIGPEDEYDVGLSTRPELQAIASLRTRLLRRGGGELVRLVVGQGAELSSGALADTFARLRFSLGQVVCSASGRYDPNQRAVVLLSSGAGWRSPHGHGLSLSYDFVRGVAGTDRTRAGLDALLGTLEAPPGDASSFEQVTAQASWRPWSWATLQLGLAFPVGKRASAPQETDTAYQRLLRRFFYVTSGLGLTSRCECWNLSLFANLNAATNIPSFGFTLDLKHLGSFGG